jgi:hypothetical protein
MVESPKATSLRGYGAALTAVSSVRRRTRRVTRVVVWLRLMISTRANFLVCTGFFITQKSCHVTDITCPSAISDKIFAAAAVGMSATAVHRRRGSAV